MGERGEEEEDRGGGGGGAGGGKELRAWLAWLLLGVGDGLIAEEKDELREREKRGRGRWEKINERRMKIGGEKERWDRHLRGGRVNTL